MKLLKLLRCCAVVWASVCTAIPHLAYGATPMGSAAATVHDVALQAGGVLSGQVLDSQGAPAALTRVVLAQNMQATATTQTDAQGRFEFAGLKSGVYQVATEKGGAVYRLWSAGTAPPAAQAQALVVNGDTVVRGALGQGGLINFLSNPWVLGGIVAAAIAIPLALDDDDAS